MWQGLSLPRLQSAQACSVGRKPSGIPSRTRSVPAFPPHKAGLRTFALPAEVSAKALTHPERDLGEKLAQFPLSFSPSPAQLVRSFGEVASKLFSPDG